MSTQSVKALELANTTRYTAARYRRDVSAGRVTVAVALADPALKNYRVVEVLEWQNRWGSLRAEQFLQDTGICSPFQVAGALTARQRARLASALRRGVFARAA